MKEIGRIQQGWRYKNKNIILNVAYIKGLRVPLRLTTQYLEGVAEGLSDLSNIHWLGLFKINHFFLNGESLKI